MAMSLDDRRKAIAVFDTELRDLFQSWPEVVSVQLYVGTSPGGDTFAAIKEINIAAADENDEDTDELINSIDNQVSALHNPAISEYYDDVTFTRDDLLGQRATAPAMPPRCDWFVSSPRARLIN